MERLLERFGQPDQDQVARGVGFCGLGERCDAAGAAAKGVSTENSTVCVLERPRHESLIDELRVVRAASLHLFRSFAPEDWARRAMQRWPNVPHLYGWLRLDRRGRWLITSGVSEGDRVVVDGLAKVRPDSPVQVEEAKAAPAQATAQE